MRPLAVAVVLLCACEPAPPPPTRELVHLRGTPYQRGLQHGQQLKSKIHSFYTTLLTSSLFPYLGREQPDIATLLPQYDDERYQHGQFAYQLLLDSAKSLERSIPLGVRDELHGISDGSGLSYDQVLVLNTFVDTTLAVRGIALAIRQSRAPTVVSVEFEGLGADGVDNDGDGQIDEADEGLLSPYRPVAGASLVEVPPGLTVKVVLKDPDGVDPATVRFGLGDTVYTADTGLTMVTPTPDVLEVRLTVPQPLPIGASLALVVSAGDLKLLDKPAPTHASFMRDEEILFTVKGAGLLPAQVQRPPLTDGRTRPPSVALSLAGPATLGGQPLVAQHFALLDANTSHKHTAVFVHHPDHGPGFAVVGWAGIVWGFAGLNQAGVGIACNPSDTLDNSVVGSVLDQVADLSTATLVARGTPIGFAERLALEQATDVAGVEQTFASLSHAYGWACVAGDAAGGQRAIEVDSDIFKEGSKGIYPFGPGDQLASVGLGDLVLGSDYARNAVDVTSFTVAGQRVVPQSAWATTFFRSRRAVAWLEQQVRAGYGQLDAAAVEALLADPTVVDASDSMNAVVLELASRRLHSAMGQVPATAAPFETLELDAELSK